MNREEFLDKVRQHDEELAQWIDENDGIFNDVCGPMNLRPILHAEDIAPHKALSSLVMWAATPHQDAFIRVHGALEREHRKEAD